MNPGYMDVLGLPSLALDAAIARASPKAPTVGALAPASMQSTRFPAGMTRLIYNDEERTAETCLIDFSRMSRSVLSRIRRGMSSNRFKTNVGTIIDILPVDFCGQFVSLGLGFLDRVAQRTGA